MKVPVKFTGIYWVEVATSDSEQAEQIVLEMLDHNPTVKRVPIKVATNFPIFGEVFLFGEGIDYAEFNDANPKT